MTTPPTTEPIAPVPAQQAAPAPAQRAVPPWRACVILALKCWFGALLLLISTVRMFWLGDLTGLVPLALFILAIAVVSTLAALVIESLTARQVPTGGHIGLIALSGLVVVGLFSMSAIYALGGLVACLLAAALGALVTIGTPTWRRYAIAVAAALVMALLMPFLAS